MWGRKRIQKRKTHCIYGHEYTPENTYVYTREDGTEEHQCRECNRRRQRDLYKRRKEEHEALFF